jgi:hypothetical protein
MAKHNARSLRASAIKGAVLTACAGLLLALVGVGSAGAVVAAGQAVHPKNTDVTGKCAVTFTSYNPSDNTVLIRLSAAAKPTKLAGYGTNAYTQMFCTVYDAGFNPRASFNPFADGPILSNVAARFTIPYSNNYHICGLGFVKLNNGDTSLTAPVCT